MHGTINFSEVEGGKVHVQGIITGMPPGEYGFHVHEKGDISGGCGTTGSHFNPEKVRMGDTELLGMESNSNFFLSARYLANMSMRKHIILADVRPLDINSMMKITLKLSLNKLAIKG